jgi:succinate dehydrogenase / fumarate reductase, cytochrome b subunit
MNKQRPVNLNLLTIKFPLPAIVSILHRISGTLLFLLIPFLLWMLYASLGSPLGFDALQDFLTNPLMKFVLWLIVVALLYHLVAGVRHLLMDAGIGESLSGGRQGSIIVFLITIVLAIVMGVWLW